MGLLTLTTLALAAAHSVSAAVLKPKRATSPSSGSFNVLSMNVAGLPAVLNSNGDGDKTTNSKLIGQDFSEYDYDVINVQEDFNYHADVYATDNHTYRTATSGGAGIGSGLNTLSNFEFAGVNRIKWDACSDASENDCLTPKGFTSTTVKVAEGIFVDIYNLHTDAGSEAGDETARDSNVLQVINATGGNPLVGGNPVVVFGDTNSRYTRSADNIREFINNGFSDVWVTAAKGGVPPTAGSDALVCATIPTDTSCETVDKIFVRGNAHVSLTPTGFYYDQARFLNASGAPLSDHIPARGQVAWKVIDSSFTQTDIQGLTQSYTFNDIAHLPSTPTISSITLRGGDRLDAVSLTYADGTVLKHGGTGGTDSTLALGSSEYVTAAQVCTGTHTTLRVFYVKLTTNLGNTVEAGTASSTCVTLDAPSGSKLVGYFGATADEVDGLGLVWKTV
ncbi:hypothetical protein MBLNU459_g1175t1 [Dothideomycetes sp. NU459]